MSTATKGAEEITRLLGHMNGDDQAQERALDATYDQLRAIASDRMARERPGHTLQVTALVHEAWLRLVGSDGADWRSRGHFFGAAAEAMRRVLIDHARRARSRKRGGDRARASVTVGGLSEPDDDELIEAVAEALAILEREDPRAAAVARLRFLAGLEVDETARVLGVSPRTVMRDWTYARVRLHELIRDEDRAGEER